MVYPYVIVTGGLLAQSRGERPIQFNGMKLGYPRNQLQGQCAKAGSDLDDPVFIGEHFGVSTASDHNLYIVGDLMYQSNYNSGLRILDVSDPENPEEVAFFDTVPHAEGPSMGGSWSSYPYFESGTIIVTSGSEGLFLLKHRREELVP